LPLYALAIFVAAFLLFLVQPLLGKLLLPWFGGGAGVWTACLLFFQVALLLGYLYADLLQRFARGRAQIVVHLAVLGLSAVWLPIGTGTGTLDAARAISPTWGVLAALSAAVGLPYLVLSSTSPLMQRWFARAHPGRSPYRLYALSNLGSVLALLSFPFLIEPRLSTEVQTHAWSLLYGVFLLAAAACGVALWRAKPDDDTVLAGSGATHGASAARIGPGRVVFWLCLAAVGSLTLMSSTNFLTQDIAPLPLLWIVPLALYLVTFIIAFEYERLYRRWLFIPLLMVAVFLNNLMFHGALGLGLGGNATLCLLAMFSICMVCHGELARSKPPAAKLTFFYLTVAAGGALGGVVVTFVAPVLFQDYWEYQAGLFAAWLLALVAVARRPDVDATPETADTHAPTRLRRLAWLGLLPLLALGLSFGVVVWKDRVSSKVIARNFYGSFSVDERLSGGSAVRQIMHGSTDHGSQLQFDAARWRPAGYYSRFSGLGLALRHFRTAATVAASDSRTTRPVGASNIGVIGLGTGTTAAYARSGDAVQFYEINPQIHELAEGWFTYLSDARERGAEIDVAIGDARVVLQQELNAGDAHGFDVLAVDAFSSDAIPVHLLTAEAGALYWQHLRPDGVLAVHISNRHLDLTPVVLSIARAQGKEVVAVTDPGFKPVHGAAATTWLLLTDNPAVIAAVGRYHGRSVQSDPNPEAVAWTDDYASLWSVLGVRSFGSVWTRTLLGGYFVLDQAELLGPERDSRLGDRARALHVSSRGERAVVVMTTTAVSAMVAGDNADEIGAKQLVTGFMSASLAENRPTGGFALLYVQATGELLIEPFGPEGRALDPGWVATAERIGDEARARLGAGDLPGDVVYDAASGLINRLAPATPEP